MICSSKSERNMNARQNPYPLKHYDVKVDKNGKRVYTETPLVAPSLAAEFSVTELALHGSQRSASYRLPNTDPVDIESKLNPVL